MSQVCSRVEMYRALLPYRNVSALERVVAETDVCSNHVLWRRYKVARKQLHELVLYILTDTSETVEFLFLIEA